MKAEIRVGNGRLIVTALCGGFVLGIVARAWMRWISTDPEFSWSGTIFIVMAFMIFTTNQSIVFLLRQRFRGRRASLVIRTFGVIFSLPLFSAAGGPMLPTVALASIGTWKTGLGNRTRAILLALSLVIPLFISKEIISDFGWTLATLGRILLFAFIYILVVVLTRPTMTPYRDENVEVVRMSKGKKILIAVGVLTIGLLFLLLTVGFNRN